VSVPVRAPSTATPSRPTAAVPTSDDSLRLEAITVSVGFDDYLDVTLGLNHPHLDTMVVVTSMTDTKTQAVCRKHGATCVQTDLIEKNGRAFNKGAAINAGLANLQYRGWRMHLDADVILPDNFRRVVFNHTHLDASVIYGADRVNIVGAEELKKYLATLLPQHFQGLLVQAAPSRPIGARIVSTLHGYLPLGCFQLWHVSCQKPYPYSLGTAAHDDMMFAALWPLSKRQLLPSVIVYHLCSQEPTWGENWEGDRAQPRFLR